MSEHDGASLLLVEDDEVLRERLARALSERGLSVRSAGSVASARQSLADPPEFAVVDLRLPDGSGLELLRELLAADPNTRVVVLTGYGSVATAIDAMHGGAVHYLQKPVTADEVLAAFAGPSAGAAEPDTPSLARAEWEYIQRVLADCSGNISEAARRLGLHRRSLQRKLAKYPPAR